MGEDRDWLAGPDAKLDRAIQQLEALKHECGHFLDRQPYYVGSQFEPEAGCHVVRFHVREKVPLSLSVIVGEIVHNLRSALEHVAWVLACRTHRVEDLWEPGVSERVTYPIAKSAEDFPKQSVFPFLDDAAKAVLAPLQPYYGRNRDEAGEHPLVRLHGLWNIDKHRIVHGGVGAIDMSTVSFVPMGIYVEEVGDTHVEWCERESPLKDGAPIAHVRIGSMSEPGTTQVQVKGQPTVQIAFGSGGPNIYVLPIFGSFAAYVLDVIETVRPLFARERHAP